MRSTSPSGVTGRSTSPSGAATGSHSSNRMSLRDRDHGDCYQPARRAAAGGQQVTITGTNFTTSADTTASIGGAPLTASPCRTRPRLPARPPRAPPASRASPSPTRSDRPRSPPPTTTPPAADDPPVANAGPDIITPIAHNDHAHVILDARASTDADGFIVSYLWTENGVTLSTNPVDSAQFALAPRRDALVTDNDGFISTDDVRVVVTATPVNPDPYYCSTSTATAPST